MRYPDISVQTESENPLALVAAVRHELRQAGIDRGEIERFSEEALSQPRDQEIRDVCQAWVNLSKSA